MRRGGGQMEKKTGQVIFLSFSLCLLTASISNQDRKKSVSRAANGKEGEWCTGEREKLSPPPFWSKKSTSSFSFLFFSFLDSHIFLLFSSDFVVTGCSLLPSPLLSSSLFLLATSDSHLTSPWKPAIHPQGKSKRKEETALTSSSSSSSSSSSCSSS